MSEPRYSPVSAGAVARLPAGVWVVGAVSLLMDVSSEMIHGLLPVFLVVVLGSGAIAVGLIEGVAEAIANFLKPLSGYLSDRLGKRKALLLAGYGLSTAAKPLFPLAMTVGWVMAARFTDRLGKGLRVAPRDALIADITPPRLLGAAYGLRHSLDSVGAVAGPGLAIVLMAVSGDDIRFVFWFAMPPALLGVLLIQFGVREPPRATPAGAAPARAGLARAPTFDRTHLAGLGTDYWTIVAIAALLNLARMSEAFVVLRAADLGLALALVPGALVVMNTVYSLAAYPAGWLSDRVGRGSLLAVGIVSLLAAQCTLAIADGMAVIAAGAALWGLHFAFSQGLLTAMIADNAPAAARGTAFGLFHFATGLAVIPGGLVAGILWDTVSPAAAFLAGGGFTLLALVALLAWQNRRRQAG